MDPDLHKERIATVERILAEDHNFFVAMHETLSATGQDTFKAGFMVGPGALEFERAMELDSGVVDALLSKEMDLARVHPGTLAHVWMLLSSQAEGPTREFIAKLHETHGWGQDGEIQRVFAGATLSSLSAGKPYLEYLVANAPHEKKTALLQNTLGDILGAMCVDPYYTHANPWPVEDMVHSYLDHVPTVERQAVATSLLDVVMDHLCHDDEINETFAAQAILHLAQNGAVVERPRRAEYADEYRDHPNLVHEAIYKERKLAANALVEAGGDWKIAWQDKTVGRSARALLRNHPIVRRDRLAPHAKQSDGPPMGKRVPRI